MSFTWDSSRADVGIPGRTAVRPAELSDGLQPAGSWTVLDDDDADSGDARRETPAWLVSLGVHLAVVFVLWGISLAPPFEQAVVIESQMSDLDPEDYAFSEAIVDLGNQSDMDLVSPSLAAAALEGHKEPQSIQEQSINELLPVTVPLTDAIEQPHEHELLDPVERVGATAHPGGIEGSLDQLALEVTTSLKQRKTLVVWVIDRSPSMAKQREAIAARLENVYRQVGMLEPDEAKSLKTALVVFGRTHEFVTDDPLDGLGNLPDLIRGITPEKYGNLAAGDDKLENVFTAIYAAATRWETYRRPGPNRRNVMIISVTDEAGSDQEHLERTITLAKRNGIKCYVVGSAAPFGRREVEIPLEVDGRMYQAVLYPGPETIVPELPHLPFWTVGESDLRQMSSGYGPYALTRLCAETGGLYLISQDTRGPRFDPDAMRERAPSYATVTDYEKDIRSHPIKMTLVTIAQSAEIRHLPRPTLMFRADNVNILNEELTNAQRPFADVDYKIDQIASALIAVEKHRPTLANARWQAHYDLTMGRLLALKVRALGYNATLANMKVSARPFEKPGSNRWRLAPSQEITGSPQVRKLAADARAYLVRVMDTHPGTPWALLAERELSQPMGWEWREERVNVPRRGQQRAGNATPGIRLADERQTLGMPQRRQQEAEPAPVRVKF